MSIYAQSIKDLIDFSHNNAELFTDEICASIANILPNLPDDIKQIAEEILKWCEKYPVIDNALSNLPCSHPIGERGVGGGKTEPTVEQIKELLHNRFPQRKPPSQDTPPKQP